MMMIYLFLLRVFNPILFKREGNNVDTPPFQNGFYVTFKQNWSSTSANLSF